MKQNKILWFVIVVLLLISVSLSFLCYHLIKKQNEAVQVVSTDIDLTVSERYAKGYVCYAEGKPLYHFPHCNLNLGEWSWVKEEYAIVRGAFACDLCMPGSENIKNYSSRE